MVVISQWAKFNGESASLPDAYFDDTDLDDLYRIPVILENPTWAQKKEIELYKTLYRGIMLVTGKPRSGKDLLGVLFCLLMKYYFGRPILLDFKPKRLFGDYIPFYPQTMIQEINKMARQAKFVSDNVETPMTEAEEDYFINHTQEWLAKNETLFKNAVLYLSELKRYCYNRNPMSRMNKFIGSLCDIHGHLDLLILGTHIDHREIDFKTYLKNVTIWANCKWSLTRPNNTKVTIRRGTYISEMGSFDVALKPFIYWVDGAMPRSFLGGQRVYDAYNTKNPVNLKPVLTKEMAYESG
jgi:hypothetical protein